MGKLTRDNSFSRFKSNTPRPANEGLPELQNSGTSLQQVPVQFSISNGDDPSIQRTKEITDKMAPAPTTAISGNLTTPPVVDEVLNSTGKSLDPETRSNMESRFAYDFSKVKIHDDDLAAKSARSINAMAYTSGNNIVFNSGQYNSQSDSGKKLLAHELTHVVQQGHSPQKIWRKPTLTNKDFDDIANKVHNAIDRIGTDEEAVYAALQRLERDRDAIKELKKIYLDKFKDSLEDDIRGDFSDEELQYALELIGITPLVKDELIINVPESELEYEAAATKLYNAMDIWGTNEEAIFGVLLAMENVPEKIAKLRAAYIKKYPKGVHGGDLEHDIRDEMSSTELDYALLLLNVVPRGNSAILTWIRSLINTTVKKETAQQVMRSLDQLSTDRLRVIVLDLKKAGDLAKFKTNLVAGVSGDFSALAGRIAGIEAEIGDPVAGTTAATAAQKDKIKDILNQGMNVDPVTGNIAAFIDVVAGRSYSVDVEETLEKEITALTPRALTRLAYPKYGWPRYEEMAKEAKDKTDAVFGHYATGAQLSSAAGPARNLFDYSEQAFPNADLLHFANYIVTGHNPVDPVYPDKTIHQVHNADLNRAEKSILDAAILSWFNAPGNKARLLDVNKTWSGAQSGGKIFLQRWDVGDVKKNRAQFWRTFQTMIHEYLHKITHNDYSTKAATLGRTKEQVFTEGGTSYFTERVWQTLYPDEIRSNATLREKVEGGVYPFDSDLIPTHTGYEQIEQFRQIVNTVGEKNASAAYFKGLADRIGLT